MTTASERLRLSTVYCAGGLGEARRRCNAARKRSDRWFSKCCELVWLCNTELAAKRHIRSGEPPVDEVLRNLRAYLLIVRHRLRTGHE